MTITIDRCARAHGQSVHNCECRTADGWLPCPSEARGIIPPFRATRVAFTGDICHDCGGPNMVRTGTCLTCQDCGTASGGCS